MKIELKSVKHIASMSEETLCFSATVYIDGVKAGEVSNRGHGGPDEYSSQELYARLDAYAKTLPAHVSEFKDEQGNPMVFEMDPELIIGELMNAYLAEKDLKRLLSNRIVFTKTGAEGTYQTKTMSKEALAKFLQQPEYIKKQLKEADKILNLLPFEEALKIFLGK